MATKKQNRRHTVRSVRRALNSADDLPNQIGARKVNRLWYGHGLTRRSLRERTSGANTNEENVS